MAIAETIRAKAIHGTPLPAAWVFDGVPALRVFGVRFGRVQ